MRSQKQLSLAVLLSLLSPLAWAHPGHLEGLMGDAMHFMLDWGYLLVMVLGALIAWRYAGRKQASRQERRQVKKSVPPKD